MSKIMDFGVNPNAILCHMLDGEVRGRLDLKKHPERKEEYKRKGVISSSPKIKTFIKKHPEVFSNRKLVGKKSNIFEGMMALSLISDDYQKYKESLGIRLLYEYDLSQKEIDEMDDFFRDFQELENSPYVQRKIENTEIYKNSIENAWRLHEDQIMNHIFQVLGYKPQNIGKVYTSIVYPSLSIQRCNEINKGKVIAFFAKREETDKYKILSYLTHQAVHQPMLPYKSTMTKEEKEKFHCFIKFLADKDTYNYLSNKSYLDIETKNENPELMGKIYPFWLGYRYRNVDKYGLNPSEEIQRAIDRDKEYFSTLPDDKKRLYNSYEFENIDANKIAEFFRERRGISPYEFIHLDFNNKELVNKTLFKLYFPNGISTKNNSEKKQKKLPRSHGE